MNQRVNVYIDGFNLYYGRLRGSEFKWLNIESLFKSILASPNKDLQTIYFFTAKVEPLPWDRDAPLRQEKYLSALRTLPSVQIVYGYFKKERKSLPLASDPNQMVEIIRTEEKGSDVNIGVQMVYDAAKGMVDSQILVSGDGDLLRPVQFAVQERIQVVIYDPRSPKKKTRNLFEAVGPSNYRKITDKKLADHQFPDPVIAAGGARIFKPKGW